MEEVKVTQPKYLLMEVQGDEAIIMAEDGTEREIKLTTDVKEKLKNVEEIQYEFTVLTAFNGKGEKFERIIKVEINKGQK